MQVIECPNCYARVVLTAERICPACNKSPESPGSDPTKTKIVVRDGQELPHECFGCGAYTDSMVSVSKATSSVFGRICGVCFRGVLIPCKFLVFGFLSLFVDTAPKATQFQRVRLKIPLCPRCRNHQMTRVKWTDFEEGTMSFIVPKTVAESIKAIRSAKS